jgi:hypothetical protein
VVGGRARAVDAGKVLVSGVLQEAVDGEGGEKIEALSCRLLPRVRGLVAFQMVWLSSMLSR